MFTGIITNIGSITDLSYSSNQDLLIIIKSNKNPSNRNFELGCSIACNGICLTLVRQEFDYFYFQASSETLSKTNIKNWQIGDKVNLEFSLRMGDELGGHLVSGHIDSVAKVLEINQINADSRQFSIATPLALKKFITQKGSVVLNGVSLTVNEVFADKFMVNIIKHTFEHTNFVDLKIGDYLNLEVDLIARYLEKLIKT